LAAGTSPIFTLVVQNWFSDALIVTANTTLDLTSGTIYLLATAGADGSRFDRLYLQPVGTNTASVARLWLNNGGVTGTAANNRWFLDFTLPATTTSIVASIPAVVAELNLRAQATYRLYMTIGTTVAAGYFGTVEGGNY
jgi:hypothetical protein